MHAALAIPYDCARNVILDMFALRAALGKLCQFCADPFVRQVWIDIGRKVHAQTAEVYTAA